MMVADIEELETMDASELLEKTQCHRGDISQRTKENLFFQIADGRIKPLGGDQERRTSTLVREHPIRGESQRYFLGE